jgi:hypothetical protein
LCFTDPDGLELALIDDATDSESATASCSANASFALRKWMIET